jgi:hypothetical protein
MEIKFEYSLCFMSFWYPEIKNLYASHNRELYTNWLSSVEPFISYLFLTLGIVLAYLS